MTVIEVIMRKEMTMTEYIAMREQAMQKGWKVQGYQLGYFAEPINTKKKIKL